MVYKRKLGLGLCYPLSLSLTHSDVAGSHKWSIHKCKCAFMVLFTSLILSVIGVLSEKAVGFDGSVPLG